MSLNCDGLHFTVSSKLFGSGMAVDINRNKQHVSAEVRRNNGSSSHHHTLSSCSQFTGHNAATVDFMSMQSARCSSATSEFIDNTSAEARPILQPPKKRKFHLTLDETVDRCTESCHAAKFPEASLPLPRADLTEWKGQRVLARNPIDSIYRPGLIRSISTSNNPIGIQFGGNDKIVLISPDNVINDSAPPSSGIFVGMRVCARVGSSEVVEYQPGVVCERILQPPTTKYHIELDAGNDASVVGPVWLSRASLRLLQVLVCIQCRTAPVQYEEMLHILYLL